MEEFKPKSKPNNVPASHINIVKAALLEEYQFFVDSKKQIFSESLPNALALDTSFSMMEQYASADLNQIENIVQLDIIIERVNTRIAMSYLNMVEEHEVELKFLTRVPHMLFKLHINKLKILKKLVLNGDNCKIIHMSPEIGALINLKELEIGGCFMTQLPDEIQNLENLEILKIRHNSIQRLPENLETLSELIELNISHNPGLKSLPQGLSQLKNLQKLSVDHDDLEYLPEDIGNLTELNEIVADHNHIKELPQSIQNLKKLKILDLHDNDLRQLPAQLNQLPSLEYINFSGNFIKETPES